MTVNNLTRTGPMRWMNVLLLGLLGAGCNRESVQDYRVAKESAAPPQAMEQNALPPGHPDLGAMPQPQSLGAAPQPQSNLAWSKPEGWTELPAGQMRVASFKIGGPNGREADVSVIPLPGAAGGDFANVNRWRGQVGLKPVSEDEVQKSAQSVEAGGQPANLYDVSGVNPGSGDTTRIIAAIQHREEMAWFFKMTGDADLVEQQKPAFIGFLKSVKFQAASQAVPSMPSAPSLSGAMPAGHPDISTLPSASAGVNAQAKPNWQVPSGWKELPGGQFLVAKFTIAGAGTSQAAVNVSESAGDGGGLSANVNRWRGQLGLSQLSQAEVEVMATTIAAGEGKATLVDMSGTDPRTSQPTRLVGAIVPQGGQTWFYKLMGDAMLVEAQKDAFTKFVQTVKY